MRVFECKVLRPGIVADKILGRLGSAWDSQTEGSRTFKHLANSKNSPQDAIEYQKSNRAVGLKAQNIRKLYIDKVFVFWV